MQITKGYMPETKPVEAEDDGEGLRDALFFMIIFGMGVAVAALVYHVTRNPQATLLPLVGSFGGASLNHWLWQTFKRLPGQ